MSDRRTRTTWARALAPLWPLAGAWSVSSVALFVLLWIAPIPSEELLLDANAYHRLPWYTGLVSSVGVLGWGVGAMGAAMTAWISGPGNRPRARQAFRGAAVLTTLLLLDDLFQLHIVVPKILGTGKALFYGVYAVLTVWWIVTNISEIRRTRWQILTAAGAALSGSILVDKLGPATSFGLVAEDSLKFLGIVAWAAYFLHTGTDIALSIIADTNRGNLGGEPSALQPIEPQYH